MKISIIGTGYVGLVSGTCFAEIGHDVTCIDIDERKIALLMEGKSPIYEPGLTELITRNIKNGRLHFSTNYQSVEYADATFLAVGTPSSDNGEANLTYLYAAADEVVKHIRDNALMIIKSTVPVGTAGKMTERLAQKSKKNFYIVNNPEFLKEGSAVEDFMRPDRVIIGSDSEEAFAVMDEMYSQLVRQGNPLIRMSNISAEMTKYAANCFLATKISFINEIAKLCDATGADIEQVRDGIKSDVRIGHHFLYPGPGYGGSCFPKDVKALMRTAEAYGMNLKIVDAAEAVNDEQRSYVFNKIKTHFTQLKGKTFAFWGVAFKANTDDIRETAAIRIAELLHKAGANVKFYDPVAADNYGKYMKEIGVPVQKVDGQYECLAGADALVILTEWREFSNPDYDKIKANLNQPVLFDARNLLKTNKVLSLGFKYYAIGKRIE
ncbi:MAG: UDP-glucose/GDP-mannose dehydrogenase family protein [Bacteriovoracaceae bacterium]|nr:UDP-glucose/GDP-mannose dehydrogenase family protein [Bacteriovoracaceae bacterium]